MFDFDYDIKLSGTILNIEYPLGKEKSAEVTLLTNGITNKFLLIPKGMKMLNPKIGEYIYAYCKIIDSHSFCCVGGAHAIRKWKEDDNLLKITGFPANIKNDKCHFYQLGEKPYECLLPADASQAIKNNPSLQWTFWGKVENNNFYITGGNPYHGQ